MDIEFTMIGSEFDDDFFEKPKEKEGSEPFNYEAKVCVPLWYMEIQDAGKDASEVLVALKHQADLCYFSQNYTKAAESYEKCLELVPPSNNTWKREFMENLSRTCLHLGDADKALEWALKLHESSFSADQKIISLNLLATVCHKLGKYEEELEALHCCLQAHKSSPEFWLRLGLCYAGLFKINLPSSSELKSRIEDPEPCCAFNSKSSCQSSGKQEDSLPSYSRECAIPSTSFSPHCIDTCSTKEDENNTFKCDICTLGVQIVSTCLIHTRVLLDSGGPNFLGAERDKKIREKIVSSLKYMEVDQSFIDVASSMLGTDFIQDHKDNPVLEQPDFILDKLKVNKKNG